MPGSSILRSLRESKDLTLTELAGRVGIGVSRLYMIETGERPCPPKVVEALSRELGVDGSVLFMPNSFTVRQAREVSAS